MTKYEIYTERKNEYQMCAILSAQFEAFTITKTVGYWKGQEEQSIIITIIADSTDSTREQVSSVASRIRSVNKQECVLISETPVAVTSLWRKEGEA